MDPSLKIILATFVALALFSSTRTTNARPVLRPQESHLSKSNSLLTRLKLADNSTSCWDSMFKLQACSGEIIQFFYNGEADLGRDCCHAVLVIVHHCWPGMLTSLGFTTEEGGIMRGYCDALENQPVPKIHPGPVAPLKDEMVFGSN